MFVLSERGAALVLFLYCTCSNASADPSAPEPLTRDRVIELARKCATRRAVINARAPGIARGIKAVGERFCSRLPFKATTSRRLACLNSIVDWPLKNLLLSIRAQSRALRPLATVVIGGLVSTTFLTLFTTRSSHTETEPQCGGI